VSREKLEVARRHAEKRELAVMKCLGQTSLQLQAVEGIEAGRRKERIEDRGRGRVVQ